MSRVLHSPKPSPGGENRVIVQCALATLQPARRPGRGLLGVVLLLAMAATAAADGAGQARVAEAVEAGRFREAEQAITAALADPGLPAQVRQAYLFQRERMRRILLDFTLDEAALEARVRRQVPDLARAEFERWKAQGLFESMTIDGRTLYFNRAPSNLFRLSPEALARRDPALPPIGDGPMEQLHPRQRAIRDAALASG